MKYIVVLLLLLSSNLVADVYLEPYLGVISGTLTTKWSENDTTSTSEHGYNGFVLGSRLGVDSSKYLFAIDFMYDFLYFPKKELNNDKASLISLGLVSGIKLRRFKSDLFAGISPYTVLKGKNWYEKDSKLIGYSAKVGISYAVDVMGNLNLEYQYTSFYKHESEGISKNYSYTVSQVEYKRPSMTALILTLSAPLPFL